MIAPPPHPLPNLTNLSCRQTVRGEYTPPPIRKRCTERSRKSRPKSNISNTLRTLSTGRGSTADGQESWTGGPYLKTRVPHLRAVSSLRWAFFTPDLPLHRSDPRKEFVYLSHLEQLKNACTHSGHNQPNSSALTQNIVADDQPKPRRIHVGRCIVNLCLQLRTAYLIVMP
jgi:hypothetical protein